MANKFLGEAGLVVLVDEIKKKAQSEGKSILRTLLSVAETGITSEENTINWFMYYYAMQMLQIVVFNLGDDITETDIESLDAIKILLTKNPDPNNKMTYGELLDADYVFLEHLIISHRLFDVDSARLKYRDNILTHEWKYINIPTEIAAEEVTSKFNS